MRKSILFLALLCITSLSYSQKVDTLNVYSLSMKKTITALVITPDQNIKKNMPSVYNKHELVKKVNYPGLETHPQHKIASELFKGY